MNLPSALVSTFRSDGTAAGTRLVADLPGETCLSRFTAVGDTLFFTSCASAAGLELWKSDGTDAGTRLVADIAPGYESSYPDNLTDVNGTLFFSAEVDRDRELWKSDGTDAGTVRVADINPGPEGSNPDWLVNVGGTLFFSTYDAASGAGLWKSDGTPLGTVQVAAFGTGRNLSSPSFPPQWEGAPEALVNADGTLYFAAGDPETGYELWKSDGTAAGTVRVTDIYPGRIGSWRHQSYVYPEYIAFPVAVNGRLFSGATHPFSGAELWALPLEPPVVPRCGDGHLGAGEDCDDGNPCTVDSCDAAGCRNDPVVGLDAIRCVFEGAGLASPVCAGQDVPPAAARRLERARQLIDAAEGARSARQVKRALRMVGMAVKRLGKKKRLSDGCAEAARRLLEDARRAATRWLDGR